MRVPSTGPGAESSRTYARAPPLDGAGLGALHGSSPTEERAHWLCATIRTKSSKPAEPGFATRPRAATASEKRKHSHESRTTETCASVSRISKDLWIQKAERSSRVRRILTLWLLRSRYGSNR